MNFLILMMTSMSLILTMSEYIINANEIYIALKDNIEEFKKEALIIDYVKCVLINKEELNDFYIDETYVSVYQNAEYYYLDYDDIELKLEVVDGVIEDYSSN